MTNNLIELDKLRERVEQFTDLQKYSVSIFIITQFQAKVLREKIEGEELRILIKKLEENFERLAEALLQNI